MLGVLTEEGGEKVGGDEASIEDKITSPACTGLGATVRHTEGEKR